MAVNHKILLVMIGTSLFAGFGCDSASPPADESSSTDQKAPLQSITIGKSIENLGLDMIWATVLSVSNDEMTCVIEDMEGQQDLIESVTPGIYIGFIGPKLPEGLEADHPLFGLEHLLRLRIKAFGGKSVLSVDLEPEHRGLVKENFDLLFFKPEHVPDADLKRIPPSGQLTYEQSNSAMERKYERLRKISVAICIYNDTYGYFLPHAILGPDNTPWHSWRVLLLPFLGEQDLYESYRWDEPWDGPNNRKLINRIPSVFQSNAADSSNTAVVALVDDNSLFNQVAHHKPGRSICESLATQRPTLTKLRDVPDPLSACLVAAELRSTISPWTKPHDLRVSTNAKAVSTDNLDALLLGNGGVSSIHESLTDEKLLQLLNAYDYLPNDAEQLLAPQERATKIEFTETDSGVTASVREIVLNPSVH